MADVKVVVDGMARPVRNWLHQFGALHPFTFAIAWVGVAELLAHFKVHF